MIAATDAEKAVLGSWLIEKEAISSCVDIVSHESFSDQFHSLVALAVLELYREGRAVDIVSVNGRLESVGVQGMLPRLADLVHGVTTAAHAQHHAKAVQDKFLLRQMIAQVKTLASKAEHDSLTDADVKALSDIAMRRDAVYSPPMFTYANGLFDFIENTRNNSKKNLYRTGFKTLDTCWYGARTGEVITIGAATNVGKSAVCLNLMHSMASRDIPCVYFGSEMSAAETTQRHVSIASGVEAFKLRIGKIDLEDQSKIHSAIADKMFKMPVSIYDHPSPSLADINSALLNTKAKVIFLDYLGRMNLPKAESYRHRVHEFMVGVKSLARKHDVLVFLAAQLSRSTYGNQSSKPTLADLSESKSIEAESDKVLLIYADQVKQTGKGTTLSFVCAKNRQGKKGQEFDMTLDGDTLTLRENQSELYA